MKKISEDEQLAIFQEVFMSIIEIPSMRRYLQRMIESRERVDMAEVNLMLCKLAVELHNQQNGGVS